MKVVAQFYVGDYIDGDPIVMFGVKTYWKDIKGKPYIWHVVERLKRCEKIDEVVLFTQDSPENKEVVGLAQKWNLKLHYYEKPNNWDSKFKFCAQFNDDDIIISGSYITPIIDLFTLESMIEYFIAKDLDYLKNKGDVRYISMFKNNIWSRLYKIEKDFKVVDSGWENIIKERNDLFKSDAFGELEEVELLGRNPQKWFPKIMEIYKMFYKEGEIIDQRRVLDLYKKDPESFAGLSIDQIELEITNDCNLNCIMCPREKMNRKIGYMDFGLFKKIIDEAEVLNIHFSGLGEPLLHPKIKQMFTYAKEKGGGLEIGLWTSGIDLSEDISKEIVEKELLNYIIFGLDAATKEVYANVKGIDCFDKAVENITRFLKLKKEKIAGIEIGAPGWFKKVRRPIVGVQILKMKETDAEIEEFMNKWDYMDKTKKMINYRNRFQELSRIENEQERIQAFQKLDKELWETFYTKAELPVEHAIIGHFDTYCDQIEDRSVIDVTPLKRFSCKQLQTGISVLWNGDVTLCRQDFNGKYPLGNLREQNLTNTLEGKRLEEIWQAHKDREYDKLPLCANCKEWYYNPYA